MANDPQNNNDLDPCKVFWSRLETLLARRFGKRWTMKHVANAAGADDRTPYKWRDGTQFPKPDKLETLAKFFGGKVEYLTGEVDLPENVGYPNNELPKIGQEIKEPVQSELINSMARQFGDRDVVVIWKGRTIHAVTLLSLFLSLVSLALGHPYLALLLAAASALGGLGLALARSVYAKAGYIAPVLTAAILIGSGISGTLAVDRIIKVAAQEKLRADLENDRRAAKYVLSIGGTVRLNGKNREYGLGDKLPLEPFRLTHVMLLQNAKVNDEGLEQLKGCNNLVWLGLDETKVTDAGLTNFKGIKGLEYLGLSLTAATDAGLANFKDCNEITYLGLYDVPGVTDAGLTVFQDCKNMEGMQLGKTKISDKGLVGFADCPNLQSLALENTAITEAGLLKFKGSVSLKQIVLTGNKQIRDACIDELQKALPNCKIIRPDEVDS